MDGPFSKIWGGIPGPRIDTPAVAIEATHLE